MLSRSILLTKKVLEFVNEDEKWWETKIIKLQFKMDIDSLC